ncbi:uncharacterized protein LOC116601451 isoform X2 [Nematostella vectensis]|uniref:uncharacterized protein LOC116601451 isoform X2 n=1 Tax=Nematostella vectensis TaxID=45351 RepID=UPI002076E04E|nr:uncharacterized protein LOC116601451 isoform X2 [Nematostella vectensis]
MVHQISISRDVSLDEVCRDTYSDCAGLARSMGLQMCPMYGYSVCKKYCRKCRSDLCRDLQPSYVCWKQRALRRCYNPYVSRVCKKKCGFC